MKVRFTTNNCSHYDHEKGVTIFYKKGDEVELNEVEYEVFKDMVEDISSVRKVKEEKVEAVKEESKDDKPAAKTTK